MWFGLWEGGHATECFGGGAVVGGVHDLWDPHACVLSVVVGFDGGHVDVGVEVFGVSLVGASDGGEFFGDVGGLSVVGVVGSCAVGGGHAHEMVVVDGVALVGDGLVFVDEVPGVVSL